MSDKAAVLQEPNTGEQDELPYRERKKKYGWGLVPNAGERDEGSVYTKAQFEKDFLEMWKRESDECAEAIYMSLPFEKPPLSARWKEAAIDAIIRMVWCSTHKEGEPDAIRENLAAIQEYTADLVEKVAAEEWERIQSESRQKRC